MKTVAVLAGPVAATNPKYEAMAVALGHEIARRGVRLLLGDASTGLGRVCAAAVHAKAGHVENVVMQEQLLQQPAYARVTTVANSLMQRASLLALADAIIALPGCADTQQSVRELLEARWSRQHNKLVLALDADDYWSPLHWHFEGLVRCNRVGHNPLVISPLPHVALQIALGPG